MSDNAREYDVVLCGQNTALSSDAVLGGIEGVKLRLSSQVIEHRISALSEALNYGEEGLAILLQALKDSEDKVHIAVYNLLKDREDPDVKIALNKYLKQYYFIRFDGLYYSHTKSMNWYLLRFYEDGTVLVANLLTPDIDVLERAARWFHTHDNRVTHRGTYKVEGNSLNFSTTGRHNIINFWGKIEMHGYTISLTFNSVTTRYKKKLEFNFVNISTLQ
ncbi:hypothetical protein RIVM261_079740 [Rivularia sp. IAM M-261]|nr:hypothetical protein RIVM261_079740 [Rivularia sp. IAM M-261]